MCSSFSTKSQAVPREENTKISKIFIRSVETYRAEYWSLLKDTAKRLAVFERKVFKDIYLGIKVNSN